MADYWIKLYHEIIDDPKMATLPDRLWRRSIELFLLAGKLCPDKSGKLPDTRQLAWLLRMNTDELAIDLSQLAATGIVESIPNGWLVVNFEKRQQAVPTAERVKQHRERKQRQQYADVTPEKRNVTQINRDRDRTETEIEEPPALFSPPDLDEPLPHDAFYLLQRTVEGKGIKLNGPDDSKKLTALINAGVTVEDVLAGIEWKAQNNNGRAIQYFGQIVGPAETAMKKRLQMPRNQADPNAGKKAYRGPNDEIKYL